MEPSRPSPVSAASLSTGEYTSDLLELLEECPTFMTLLASEDGLILSASEAVLNVLGYTPAELLGSSYWDMMHPDDRVRVKADASATRERGRRHFSNQYRRRHKAGHYVYVTGALLFKSGRLYAQEHSIDSEIRRQSLESKQAYISTTAHDLKTHVTVFQSAIELLQQTRLSEEQSNILSQAQAAADLIQMTLDQAVEVGKLGAGEPIKPSLGPVDVGVLLRRCRTLLDGYGSSLNPGVTLTFRVDEGLAGPGSRIITDRCWLWQMIMNYLTNAVRFTAEGEIVVEVSRRGGALRFEVRDPGIGVDEHLRQRLFEPFPSSGVASRGTVGGTAQLGLYSVKLKADQLGGRCGLVDVPEGTGSIFFFEVPYIPEGRYEDDYQRLQTLTSNEVIKDAEPSGWLPLLGETADDATLDSAASASASAAASPPPSSMPGPGDSSSGGAARGAAAPAAGNGKGKGKDVSGKAALPVGEAAAAAAGESGTAAVEEAAAGASAAGGSAGPAAAAAAPTATALVIDDTGSVRKLLVRTLEGRGVSCEVARNGLEGLHMMRERQYSLVLCDAFMPVMSGMECIQRFRQWEQAHRQQRQFIVGISSYLEGFDRDSGKIDAFLPKPIDLKWLRELVRIARETQQREGAAAMTPLVPVALGQGGDVATVAMVPLVPVALGQGGDVATVAMAPLVPVALGQGGDAAAVAMAPLLPPAVLLAVSSGAASGGSLSGEAAADAGDVA